MRIGRVCLATAWLAIHGSAQVQAPRSPYAAITGIVLNDSTGTPLRRVLVTLSTLDTPPLDAVTYSESNGAFGFTNVPPGKYRLYVHKEGFQPVWFGAATPKRPPGTLMLGAGDVRFGITFRLRPLGSISGTVIDPDGDPVPNAQIRLMHSAWARRKPAYSTEGWATTDSSGRYHLDDVVPGEYVVMAAEHYQPAALIQTDVSVGQPAQQKMYLPQFYPDASRMSSAESIQLTPGKELDGIDFHLVARVAAPLHGKVVVPDDVPPHTVVQIAVYPQEVPDDGNQSMGSGAVPPNYTFNMMNLLPGPYLIVAHLDAPGHHYRGFDRIELPPGGQEITMRLDRGIDLAGRVDLEGGGEHPSEPFRVTLISGDRPQVQATPAAQAKPDGSFVIPDVLPGIWDINVEPVPKGGFIKSMLLGDQDVLTEDMIITSGTRDPLRIVVSTRGAVVTGTVTVPQGVSRSARARVLLAPSGKYENVLSFYAIVSADDTGHFEFKAITPGKYKLYAFEELDPSSFEDPTFLKPFEEQSEAFDVPEGARISREVQLIPAGTQTSARK
jgi:hypothetical protein